MKIREVIDVLRALSPEQLAEDWDKVGLHMGRREARVKRALLCIDLTEAVLAEAIEKKAGLIVAYHPPIFAALGSVTDETVKGRIVLGAAEAGIAVYSPHTALDAAAGGVNDWLAEGIGEGAVRPIRPTATSGANLKLVVFVPEEETDRLRAVLLQAGAGCIGRYSKCSFSVAGEGTFQGDASTHPARGKAERFERVKERRLEMVLPRGKVAEVVRVLKAAHPYEEPAFDLYPMEVATIGAETGQGRVVELNKAVSLGTLIERIKKRLGLKHLEVGKAAGRGRIKRIGLCAGAGGSLLKEAGQIDAFFTGEMRHHDVLAAVSEGVSVVLAGHTQTERPYLKRYRQRLRKAAGEVQWMVSGTDRAASTIV